MTKAYINILAEEGSRDDLVKWLHRLHDDAEVLRGAMMAAIETDSTAGLRDALRSKRGF